MHRSARLGFAERPDLSRNFLPGSAEALALDMMVQKSQETAALAAGFPDVVGRATNLRALGGKIDPDWDIAVDSAPDGTTVHLIPKDSSAFIRSVVGGSLQVRAQPANPAAALSLAPGIVRNYLSSAVAKTGTRTRIQAIRAATDAGWLSSA